MWNNPEEPLNPYVIGNAVGNSSAFVGREDVLQDVRNVLKHSQQNAIVLYGQRRIGKTSILKELEAQLAQAGYLPIFFDLQDKGKLPLDQVNQELANKISDKLNSQAKLTLEDIFSHWKSPKKLVILFDEFEAFAGNEFEERQASETFIPYWRDILSKVDKAKLNFVFTLGRKVEALNEKAMSLLKDFPSKKVSLLTQNATFQLIRLSDSEDNKTLKWSKGAIKAVWTQTGGHPFITQILCYCIWNHFYETNPYIKPTVRLADVNENLLVKALETGENAFQWLWNGLPATAKLVTSILANIGNKPITTQALEQWLKDNGLRIRKEDQQKATDFLKDWDVIEFATTRDEFRFRAELFRRWIAENKPLSKVQLEFVQGELERITVKIYTDTGFKGTGFFVTPDGYILTAWHFIKDFPISSLLIESEYHGRQFKDAQVDQEKSMKEKDIAVIKINFHPKTCVPLGVLEEGHKGDEAISVGYPGGYIEDKDKIKVYPNCNISGLFDDNTAEIVGIQGEGHSGGLVYHYATQRVIGMVTDLYKKEVMANAGLAVRFDFLLREKWLEVNDEIAKAWDERLAPFTSKMGNSGLENTYEKNASGVVQKIKNEGKVDKQVNIGSVNGTVNI
jgi:hypothetical protein